MVMGKENFSSSWCNWCKLSKADWQNTCPVSDDMMWDIHQIDLQVDCNVKNGFTDARMKGVRSSPMSSIPFSRIIFSGLHAAIGIGNRIIQHLEEFIDVDVEEISHEEFQLRAYKTSSEDTIKTLRGLKEVWTKSPDGGRLLQSINAKMKRLDAELKQCPDEMTRANISGERDSLENEIDALIATRAHYTQQISHTDKYLKDASSRLDSLTKSRRNGEDSVYTEVDKTFQSIGANRAHYFGRALEGVDIKKIMAKSDDLFGVGGTLRQKLLQHTSHPDKVVIVNKVCDDVGLAFKLWDGAFSAIHSPNPTVEHCEEWDLVLHQKCMGWKVMW